jgi:hypothetical protein
LYSKNLAGGEYVRALFWPSSNWLASHPAALRSSQLRMPDPIVIAQENPSFLQGWTAIDQSLVLLVMSYAATRY